MNPRVLEEKRKKTLSGGMCIRRTCKMWLESCDSVPKSCIKAFWGEEGDKRV